MAYPATLRSMQTIFPSDTEGIKWTKLCLNLKESAETSGVTIPADLRLITPGDSAGVKWALLGRWMSLLSAAPAPAPQVPVGYYTPEELTASRDLASTDAGKWLYNLGNAKTLTIPGDLGAGYRGEIAAVFNWLSGYGSLGYWLPRPAGADVASGIGATLGVVNYGLRYTLADASFYDASGNPATLKCAYLMDGSYPFTLAQDTRVTIGIHPPGASARTITFNVGGYAWMVVQDATHNLYAKPVMTSVVLPAGEHTLVIGGYGDNPAMNGIWFDAANATPIAGPMVINQSVQGFQAGADPITIVAGRNTLVAPGLTTKGVGSWFEIKKISDNVYHAHGDLA